MDITIWIFAENICSIKLHDCGFRIVGIREKIGKKNGVWKDNKLMEYRSKIVGID
jgi:phosphinothricin acetyltransferase